ncbi:MAG TPA: BTAD domain-containing putative transcriptional regulator [Ktedonobacteraceae bacterium]|nr:BTAD domain-containing putative transcriptional regulator [Ktedonobacteraceae bacterium]
MLRSDHVPASLPIMRVYLFGECVLERLAAAPGADEQAPRYEPVSHEEWRGRGPALALLKVLLCRRHRRAMKDELVEALWPEPDEDEEDKRLKSAERALDAAVSVLRKVLTMPDGTCLLTTTAGGDGMIYKLSGQETMWVDADAFEQLIQQALRVSDAQEAIPVWETAYQLTQRGEFLEEDRYRDWARPRRDVLAGRIGNAVHLLADLYIQQDRLNLAQDLLWDFVGSHPTDEDALYRLLLLLERQDRLMAASYFYQQIKDTLARDGLVPSSSVRALAKRIHQQRAAQEIRVFERALVLPRASDALASLNGSTIDCATWFAVRQAEILDVIEQWKGHALQCDELQVKLHFLLAALNERQPGQNPAAHAYSRRQVLLGIAALALPLLVSGREIPRLSLFAEEFLPQCAAAIMACRQLMKGDDFFQAEAIVLQYLPALETLMKESLPYQPTATRLLLQCDKLAGTLTSHRLQWGETEHHDSHAVSYSDLVPDQSVQAMMRTQLASTHFYLKGPHKALPIYEEVTSYAKSCSPLTKSNFYVKRAASYAQAGYERETRESLDAARQAFPNIPEDDPAFLYADFGRSSLFLWEGLSLLELARHGLSEPRESWEAFASGEALDPKMIMSERNRVEIINYQAATALIMEDLDLLCPYLRRGIEGANRLNSVRRQQEAATNYWQARKQWPHEQRIKDMAELFIAPGRKGEVRA